MTEPKKEYDSSEDRALIERCKNGLYKAFYAYRSQSSSAWLYGFYSVILAMAAIYIFISHFVFKLPIDLPYVVTVLVLTYGGFLFFHVTDHRIAKRKMRELRQEIDAVNAEILKRFPPEPDQTVYVPTYIDGKPYAVTLPTGGDRRFESSDWRRLYRELGEDNSLLHWKHAAFWCQEHPAFAGDPDTRVCFGYYAPYHWFVQKTSWLGADIPIGYRPKLFPLNPDTMQPDPSILSSFQNGEVLSFGTLFMGDQPLRNPENPTKKGDIPRYLPGAALRIGDTDASVGRKIRWIKFDDFLISDRVLLNRVPWTALDDAGLVRIPNHKERSDEN